MQVDLCGGATYKAPPGMKVGSYVADCGCRILEDGSSANESGE